jgi:hypothetical protein
VVVQRDLYDSLVRTGVQTESPLTRWLLANYQPAFAVETYEFWVRKGRSIAALDTATLFDAAKGTTPAHKITLILAAPEPLEIGRIDLGRFDGDLSTILGSWTNSEAQLFRTPLNSAGVPVGSIQPVSFPFQVHGIMRIDLLTDRMPRNPAPNHGIIYLRDPSGRRVAEARFVQ